MKPVHNQSSHKSVREREREFEKWFGVTLLSVHRFGSGCTFFVKSATVKPYTETRHINGIEN